MQVMEPSSPLASCLSWKSRWLVTKVQNNGYAETYGMQLKDHTYQYFCDRTCQQCGLWPINLLGDIVPYKMGVYEPDTQCSLLLWYAAGPLPVAKHCQ